MLIRLIVATSLALSLSAVLAGEHGDTESDDVQRTDTGERVCFNRRQVNSFDGLSDWHILVKEGVRDYYLLTTRHRCSGLRDARRLGFNDARSRICANSVAEIFIRDLGGLGRCRIADVERVENKDEALAIIREREEHARAEKDAAGKKDD